MDKSLTTSRTKVQYDDDYVYSAPHFYEKSINRAIMNNLQGTDNNMKANLSPIKNFKRQNNIDSAFYTKTGVRSLTNDDNYIYEKNVKNNFWDLIFEKPKYHSILNSDPRNYIAF